VFTQLRRAGLHDFYERQLGFSSSGALG
jgi:hypothetical protein